MSGRTPDSIRIDDEIVRLVGMPEYRRSWGPNVIRVAETLGMTPCAVQTRVDRMRSDGRWPYRWVKTVKAGRPCDACKAMTSRRYRAKPEHGLAGHVCLACVRNAEIKAAPPPEPEPARPVGTDSDPNGTVAAEIRAAGPKAKAKSGEPETEIQSWIKQWRRAKRSSVVRKCECCRGFVHATGRRR